MYENKFQWARKIGFGFRPKDIIPENIDQWNKEQLNSDNQDIGLNGEGVWPESYNFSLEERLNRLHTFMTKKEKYESYRYRFTDNGHMREPYQATRTTINKVDNVEG